ncbi:MAG: transposase [Candidatus Competibacteraceae bacterium]
MTVTLSSVAGRGKELVENVLDGFTGWLMSDGWIAYRHYPRRLRCWAHLIRKARGLAQSCDRKARFFWPAGVEDLGSPTVLSHPELPLTNNDTERALRHWVILRKLSLGTRTPVGSRGVALLASVIDTCRQRGPCPLALSGTRHRGPPG